jgi:hypothetical protein
MELALLIIAVAFAAGAFYQAFISRVRTERIAQLLDTLERRVMWVERDVTNRLVEGGLDPVEVDQIHPIYPPFSQMENEMRAVLQRSKNPG